MCVFPSTLTIWQNIRRGLVVIRLFELMRTAGTSYRNAFLHSHVFHRENNKVSGHWLHEMRLSLPNRTLRMWHSFDGHFFTRLTIAAPIEDRLSTTSTASSSSADCWTWESTVTVLEVSPSTYLFAEQQTSIDYSDLVLEENIAH